MSNVPLTFFGFESFLLKEPTHRYNTRCELTSVPTVCHNTNRLSVLYTQSATRALVLRKTIHIRRLASHARCRWTNLKTQPCLRLLHLALVSLTDGLSRVEWIPGVVVMLDDNSVAPEWS